MLEFKISDRVSFRPDDRPARCGVLTKYNKKTVTVITDNGEHWNVAPQKSIENTIDRGNYEWVMLRVNGRGATKEEQCMMPNRFVLCNATYGRLA
jgi:hypothetical protein